MVGRGLTGVSGISLNMDKDQVESHDTGDSVDKINCSPRSVASKSKKSIFTFELGNGSMNIDF